MRAKTINEIRQDMTGSGLGSLGIGRVAYNKGYEKIKQMMGNDVYMLDELTDINVIKGHSISKIIQPITTTLKCALNELLFAPREFFSDNVKIFLEEEVFRGWRRSAYDGDFVRFTYEPKEMFNKGIRKEYTVRIECWTSIEWGVTQVIVYKEFTKTFERTGETYYYIRYK